MTAPARPEVLALLRAVKDAPDDDTPRLVLADLLEEQGDPRGEFVRIQCRLAQSPGNDPSCAVLQKRQDELWQQHNGQWAGTVFSGVKSVRGLLHVSMHAPSYVSRMRDGLAETETWAWVEKLSLSGERADMVEVCGSAGLASISSLDLDKARFRWEQLGPFFHSPHLAGLRSLSLTEHRLGRKGMEVLVTAPALTRLTSLFLAHNALGDPGAALLAGWPGLASIRTLVLGNNSIGIDGVRALAASPFVANVTSLSLWGYAGEPGIGDECARVLAGSPHLERLESLELGWQNISPAGIELLATARRSLRRIGCWAADYTPEQRAALTHAFGDRVVFE